MALPKLNQKTYIDNFPVSGKEFKYRPYTVGEEKAIIQTLEQEGQDNITGVLDMFFNLLQNCIIEPKNIKMKDIPMVDFLYAFIIIRCKSKGEKMGVTFTCESCNMKYVEEFDIIKSLVTLNPKTNNIFHKIDDSLTVELVPVKTEFILENAKENRKPTNDDVLAYSIKSINFDGTVYNNFTIEELKENIVNQLNDSQIAKAANELDKMTRFILKFEKPCKCKYKNKIEVEDPLDFLFSSATTNN